MAFAPAARNFEIVHPLAASDRWRAAFSSRGPLLAALVLLCLIPRAVAAWKIDTLCKDGVFYVQLASGYERGDLEAGLGRLRLNTYPLILAALHQCGLSWELAARLWGVAVSSLVVLPLFGWLRRQFNDRAAICACLLYAIHPKMIEWSPEAVRDPTFWLFWTCSLYAAWRAVTEVRLVWFLAAGAAIA
ncbi:MAG TPA: glycosyltransferase family 39 protein, partial [Pirellulales bacterium]|nr:glycosyltransferase family 39 protein [Pirellulales bacterium]